MKHVLDVEHVVNPDLLASQITNKFDTWKSVRKEWEQEKRELRNYIYATDTKSTSNNKLPWANSTTTPKLTQIYDNLKANYTAALFPQHSFVRWTGDEFTTPEKVRAIQTYVDNKIQKTQARLTFEQLVDDWLLFGNCFAMVDFETNFVEQESGAVITQYVGPVVTRISPYDIVFDITAAKFEKTPKIIRSIVQLGSLKKMVDDGEEQYRGVFDRVMSNRSQVAAADSFEKSDGFIADGFSSLEHYYGSNYIEILTFYGDIYDPVTQELKENRKVVIADRSYIIEDKPIESWYGTAPVIHSGWRNRVDNLMAMGPLDNLVGMQYRIDHLENLKADVFDQIALPILKIRGEVRDFEYEPGARVYLGEDGDVAPVIHDSTALNADLQIQALENKMEELAGAPRQAMGIRTPGEKTAFEVQTLQNSASRIFQHKAAKFEMELLEPVLNNMLEVSRREMDRGDTIRVLDESGAVIFETITKEDITAEGKISPMGARHFAERALRVQNLNQLIQVKVQDPSIGVHLSGKKIAEILAQELNEPDLFAENVGLDEQKETELAANDTEAALVEDLQAREEGGF